jgi:phosphoribosylformylglycinamidine cyclo-ligase
LIYRDDVSGPSYDDAGVGGQGRALSAVARQLGPTFSLPHGAEVLTRFGHYASVLRLSDDIAVALCTDGVGSKTMVASALDRYDTIGFDCVAMNVNDLICIGARPIALVDYLGVHTLDGRRSEEILEGLGAAAKEAGIAIPGGEIAQLPEIIGSGDDRAFDLVGTCLGTLHPDEMILGDAVTPGDVIVGIASSGIHSNGLTLARRVLLDGGPYSLTDRVASLGRTLGEELLEPTTIYVRAALDLWEAEIQTRGLVHITGDGVLNLCRLESEVGYLLDRLPETPAIFELIKQTGGIDDAELFRVFNMGIGLCVIVSESDVDPALARIAASGYTSQVIGRVIDEANIVRIEPHGLMGGLVDGESMLRRR